MENIQIPTSQTDFLREISSIINLGMRFCWAGTIFGFFRDESSLNEAHSKTVEEYGNTLDEYVTNLIKEIEAIQRVDKMLEKTA